MKPRDIQEALDYCLANPDNLEAEQLLARFPRYREELGPLLGLAHRIESSPPPAVPAGRRAAMKERLMLAAAVPKGSPTQQNAQPASVAPAVAVRPVRERKPHGIALLFSRRFAWATAGAMVLLVAFFWMASSNALADSPLYSIKLAAERVQVNLANSPAQLVRLHSDLATKRVREARTMADYGKLHAAAVTLDNYSTHVDAGLAALDAITGSERSQLPQLARVLYTSGEEGRRTFADLQNVPNLPDPIEAGIKEALANAVQVQAVSEGVLVSAGIDPRTIPTPNMPEMARPTPEGRAAAGTSPAPGGTGSTASVGTPIHVGPTAIAAAAALTALAVPKPAGDPARSAAMTVVAGTDPSGPTANPTQIARAQQTVLSAASPPAAASATGVAAQATQTTITAGAASPTRTDTALPVQPPATGTPVPPASTRVPATDTPAPPASTPTNTPPVVPATPVETNTPAPADTATQPPVPPVPTSAQTLEPPPVTATDTPALDPFWTPTNTPVPPGDTPTHTPVPTALTITPASTPADTPGPQPTDTATAQPGATFTFTAVPTATHTPVANVCNLEVQSMSAQCESGTCLAWEADVENTANTNVTAGWTAELQASFQGGSGFETVASVGGTLTFEPGGNSLGDEICYDFPPNTQRIRIRLRFDTGGYSCNPQGNSGSIAPCEEDGPPRTPTVEPPGTP